jgi:hypothetical protein
MIRQPFLWHLPEPVLRRAGTPYMGLPAHGYRAGLPWVGHLPGHLLDRDVHGHVAFNMGLSSCMEDLGPHGHAGPGSGEFADVHPFVMTIYTPELKRKLNFTVLD